MTTDFVGVVVCQGAGLLSPAPLMLGRARWPPARAILVAVALVPIIDRGVPRGRLLF